MIDFSRRQFLKYTGAGAIATIAPTLTFAGVARAASTTPLPVGTPILVIVTLYGGNDGLNTVVPYQDPVYLSSRPGLSLTPDEVLPISADLALNGVMTGFKALWDQNHLAIVLGTSYPNPNYSHFSSMAIWQSASPVEQVSSGWIGRWLDSQAHSPFNVIGIGDTLTPLMAGEHSVGSVLPVGGLQVPYGTTATLAQQLAQPSKLDSRITAEAAQAIGDLFEVAATVSPVLKNAPPNSASALGQQLDVVANLIAANVPTRVYSVTMSGFDLHADELSEQNTLLGNVSEAVSGLLTQLATSPRANDVVVMVYSEFGRRVVANGSHGTDHGTSAPVFVAGARVAGGLYGEQPSLTQLVGGDLAVTTDFRDVYASMLHDVLQSDPTKALNNWPTKLNLITAS